MSTPATKSIEEINAADQDDAALQAYKASLLGGAIGADGKGVAKFPDDPRKVIVESVKIVFDEGSGAPKSEVPLSSGCSLVIKEAASFSTWVTFYVQHDIALGLKVTNTTTKLGITVDTETAMLGSFAPKLEPYVVRALTSVAPEGFLARTSYGFQSLLHDDDGKDHNTIKGEISIKSEWSK